MDTLEKVQEAWETMSATDRNALRGVGINSPEHALAVIRSFSALGARLAKMGEGFVAFATRLAATVEEVSEQLVETQAELNDEAKDDAEQAP